MGTGDPEHPEFQVGQGCLVDQLLGQQLADVCGLGPLLDPQHVRKALESIYHYNHKSTLYSHDCVQRTYALNDESALVVCDYATAPRPRIPFPYFAEVWSGLEYSTASHMLAAGLIPQGIESITNTRNRYDGERRNPWDEAECGHHYARAMAAWSAILALSGFRYHGGERRLSIRPPAKLARFKSFWSTATAWGIFTRTLSSARATTEVQVYSGQLPLAECRLQNPASSGRILFKGLPVPHRLERRSDEVVLTLGNPLTLGEGDSLTFQLSA